MREERERLALRIHFDLIPEHDIFPGCYDVYSGILSKIHQHSHFFAERVCLEQLRIVAFVHPL